MLDRYETLTGRDDDGNEWSYQSPVYRIDKFVEKTEERSTGAGAFGKHIGYAPVMVLKPDHKKGKGSLYADSGEGELGKLMSEYYYWNMVEAEGITLSNRAAWEKPLWDDHGMFMSAPSIRSVVDIGIQAVVTIAGAVASPFTGGASLMGAIALNVALNMADDAVFGVLDIMGGYKTAGEAGFEFGKKLLSTTASAAIGAGFGGVGGNWGYSGAFEGLTKSVTSGMSGLSGVVAKTALGGMQSVLTTTATSAINSVTYTSGPGGGFGFDSRGFGASMQSGMIWALSGMANTFVNEGLGAWNSSGTLLDGFNSGNKVSVGKFNSFLGGLAGEGVNYALTGTATFNIANLSMLGINDRNGNKVSQGLLELRVGKNGAGMGLGSGGMDASYGAIAESIKGIGVLGTNARINNYVKNGGLDIAATLRSQYGYGDSVQKSQLKDILNGKAKVAAGNGSGEAQTISSGGQRTIYLDGYREGMSLAEQMALGVTLGHEGYRDGLYNGEEGQRLETQGAVKAHTEMLIRMMMDGQEVAGNDNLAKDLAAYFQGNNAFNAYVDANYDSSADYWKLRVQGGKIFADWDGTQNVTLPDGTVLKVSNDTGKLSAGKLVSTLFATKSGVKGADVETLFNQAGLTWSKENGEWEYANGAAFGSIPYDANLSIDLTALVSGTREYKNDFNTWLQGGMEGVPLLHIGGLSDGLFGYVNRNRLLSDITTQINGLSGTPIENVNALRNLAQTNQFKIGDTMIAGTGLFGEQYQRMYGDFVNHIGGSIAPAARSMTFSSNFGQYNGINYSSIRNGKSAHTAADSLNSVKGTPIYSGFGGRLTQENSNNPLAFSTTLSDTKSVVTFETGFQFGNEFISTGVWLQPRHMTSIIANTTEIFKFAPKLGNLGAVWDAGPTTNHLHMDIVTRTSSNESMWFQKLFQMTNYASDITWRGSNGVIGTDTYNRTYWDTQQMWDNYWQNANKLDLKNPNVKYWR